MGQHSASLHLMGQLEQCSPSFFGYGLQRRTASGGVDGDGAQQVAEHMGAAGVESAASAAGKAGDLPETESGDRIASFVKHKGGDAEQTKFPGQGPQSVNVLLQAVPDIDQGVDFLPSALVDGVLQDFGDPSLSGEA